MAVLYYDPIPDYGSGKIFIESLVGTYRFECWDKILADIVDADITPFGSSPSISTRVRSFLKITDLGPSYPFTSTPEVRYKIGTYVPFPGYEVIITPEGKQVYPYQDTPQFLIYERQALPEFRAFIPLGGADEIDYSVTMGATPTINLDVNLHDATIDFFSFQGLQTLIGFDINLNDGIVADLEVYYTWFTYPFSSSETRPKINVTF